MMSKLKLVRNLSTDPALFSLFSTWVQAKAVCSHLLQKLGNQDK